MIEQQTTNPVIECLEQHIHEGIERSAELKQPVLVSIAEEIEPVDPLRLFTNCSSYSSERWYWEHPEEELAIVAAGVASNNIFPWKVRFSESTRLHKEVSSSAILDSIEDTEHPGLRFFAAFSFDPERKPDRRIWKGFPAVSFAIPRVMLLREGDRYTLTYNIFVSPRRDAETILKSTRQLYERTHKALEKELQVTRPQVHTSPSPEDEVIAENYRQSVALGSQAVRDGEFEKVVLARYRDIRTDNYFDIAKTLDRLRSGYPGCYTFAVERHGSIFLGASPEQLVRQEQKQVRAACLAGSIKRGNTPEEDEALAAQLLNSAKDQHEHEVCARAIREALEPLCAEIDIPEKPQILSFSNVHHLYTPVRGTLSNGSTLIDLVERLHPTPAVGGYPKESAQTFIREYEGFDRGWYASPIGWLDAEGNGEFLVALRSAIISGQRARLFAGCGIVGESDPDQELAESEVKLRAMLSALEGDAS